jgi:hypothetical protein
VILVMTFPLSTSRAGELAGSTERFPTLLGMLHELARGFLDPYRPERHYMRGPGPRWRERHVRWNSPSWSPHFEQGREE